MSYIEEAHRLARSFYEVLGVEKDASIHEIKKAYRDKLLSTHPDKMNGKIAANNSSETALNDDINSIQVAFKVLSDEEQRKNYDESLSKSVQRAGFNISGEGLDSYSLDEFELNEEELKYYKNCPRCQFPGSVQISEADLEHGSPDGTGGYNLIVQCDSCSLWLIVNYYEGESEHD
ncbi:Diphthamide biosynthesis protein 4 [Meyerozyma sp. JA9]|nr:Diphthamide biosynthesis protein 4 [Meyerozyma sp. JA9]